MYYGVNRGRQGDFTITVISPCFRGGPAQHAFTDMCMSSPVFILYDGSKSHAHGAPPGQPKTASPAVYIGDGGQFFTRAPSSQPE